jgi:hypothetical protein
MSDLEVALWVAMVAVLVVAAWMRAYHWLGLDEPRDSWPP